MLVLLPTNDTIENVNLFHDELLEKQRLEVSHTISAIFSDPESDDWQHPCARMWRNYVQYLAGYGMLMCVQWKIRGHEDRLLKKFSAFKPHGAAIPYFLYNERLNKSHQAWMIRKYPEIYSELFTVTKLDMPLEWLGKENEAIAADRDLDRAEQQLKAAYDRTTKARAKVNELRKEYS